MNIDFTKQEYQLLLELAFLGQWMLLAHQSEPVEDSPHEMLAQKIMSHANEMGCDTWVEASQELNGYYPTQEFEEHSGVFDAIDRYNDNSFWDELVIRLAERDAQANAESRGSRISGLEELRELAAPFENKYADEFYTNGLDNLFLRGS